MKKANQIEESALVPILLLVVAVILAAASVGGCTQAPWRDAYYSKLGERAP